MQVVVLALPASAHGLAAHRQALNAAQVAFPGCKVVGPERRWDTILTSIAAQSKLAGAHALVFGAFQGQVSRGVYEIANAAKSGDALPGGPFLCEGGKLYADWAFDVLPKDRQTRRHFAAVRPVGEPRRP